MSGLEALGLACNIFQVISFGNEVVQIAKHVYDHGSIDNSLAERSAVLENLSSHIRTANLGNNAKKHRRDLIRVAEKCQIISRDLREETAFLLGESAKGSLIKTLKIVAKTTWRKRRLDRLQKDLIDVERLMNTGLLTAIFDKVTTFELEQQAFDRRLQHFIHQYHAGNRSLKDLVVQESEKTRQYTSIHVQELRQHISKESKTSTRDIRHHVDSAVKLSTAQISKQMVVSDLEKSKTTEGEKLIRSFKYPGMNQRRNDVDSPHPATFKWLFSEGSDDFSSDDSEYDSEYESGYQSEDTFSASFESTTRPQDEKSQGEGFSSLISRPELDIKPEIPREDDDSDEESCIVISEDTPSYHDDQWEQHWDRFPDWLRSNEKVYWISGKPGSGKTTLVKFILSKPDTVRFLEQWKADPILVSHFFWRPGNQMQQSIKGMLCTLLHQLLLNCKTSQDLIIRKFPVVKWKDVDTDWSTQELLRVMNLVLGQFVRPICMFIDGLDEVSAKDGVAQLLSIVGQFSQYSNVKVCLSSRPEPLLLQRLQAYPQLRIHDLTYPDLRIYALDSIGAMRGDNVPHYSEIIDLIVNKAEGVFLWLCLAIKSVSRGLEQGDDIDELEVRIHSLPGDLAALYEDMLERMSEDLPVYRQSIAATFRLLIAKQHLGGPWVSPGLTVFELMLASTSMSHDLLKEPERSIDPDDMLWTCRKLQKDIFVRCAGLLQVFVDYDRPSRVEPWSQDHKDIIPFAQRDCAVKFIHRTAFDFLQNTVKGKEILRHDTSSEGEIRMRIITTILSSFKIFKSPLLLGGSYETHSNIFETSRLLRLIYWGWENDNDDDVLPHAQLRLEAVEHCRALNSEGWLREEISNQLSGHCSGLEFYELCIDNSLLDYAVDVLSRVSFEQSTLSRFLCFITLADERFFAQFANSRVLYIPDQLYSLLLEKGAEPNSIHALPHGPSGTFCFNENPLGIALELRLGTLFDSPFATSTLKSDLTFFQRVVELAKHGAHFDKLSCYSIQYRSGARKHKGKCCFEGMRYASAIGNRFTARPYPEDGCIALVMLTASTVIRSLLQRALNATPSIADHPDITEIRKILDKIAVNSNKNGPEFVAAIFKYHTERNEVLDPRKIPYRQVSDHEDSLSLLSSVEQFLETGQEFSSESLGDQLFASFEQSQPGHGSVFNLLCDLGVLSERIFEDESGGTSTWSEAQEMGDRFPSWRRDFYSEISNFKLDSELVAELEGHRDCCEEWVNKVFLESEKAI